jgi:hypothetical protein
MTLSTMERPTQTGLRTYYVAVGSADAKLVRQAGDLLLSTSLVQQINKCMRPGDSYAARIEPETHSAVSQRTSFP